MRLDEFQYEFQYGVLDAIGETDEFHEYTHIIDDFVDPTPEAFDLWERRSAASCSFAAEEVIEEQI